MSVDTDTAEGVASLRTRRIASPEPASNLSGGCSATSQDVQLRHLGPHARATDVRRPPACMQQHTSAAAVQHPQRSGWADTAKGPRTAAGGQYSSSSGEARQQDCFLNPNQNAQQFRRYQVNGLLEPPSVETKNPCPGRSLSGGNHPAAWLLNWQPDAHQPQPIGELPLAGPAAVELSPLPMACGLNSPLAPWPSPGRHWLSPTNGAAELLQLPGDDWQSIKRDESAVCPCL